MVDIRQVDMHRVSRYLSKYLTKELLLSAPLWCRRVTASRGIELLPAKSGEWRWENARIGSVLMRFIRWGAFIESMRLDEEGELDSFEVSMRWARSP